MRLITLLLCTFLLAACDSVTTDGPIGTPVAIDASQWEGIWLHEESAITIRVVDAAAGELESAWIETKNDGLVMERQRGQIRQAGQWQFAVMPAEGEADTQRYFLARALMEDGRLILWTANPAAFRAAVETGRLPGTVEDDDVRLPAPDDALVEKLIADGPTLFDWESPLVLIRYRR